MKLIFKHLPGQHNQMTHGRRGVNSLNVALGELGENSPINIDLRNGRQLDDTSNAMVKVIDNGMKPLDNATTVYRGINSGYTQKQMQDIFGTDSPKVGTIFTEKGYSSTSYDKSTALRFAHKENSEFSSPTLFIIKARKGAMALTMGRSAQHAENELLLARNTTFKIVDRQFNNGTTTYTLTIE